MIQALFVGRLLDIARYVQAGDLTTARNLVANTPGVDWAARLPPATYTALFGPPEPAADLAIEDAVVQEAMAL